MRKFLAAVLMTGLLLLGSGLLLASSAPAACPAACCTGPEDCPYPPCCAKR